jgi:hypothetical protein
MTAPLRGRVGAVTGLADRCRHRRAPASARSLFTGLKAQKWAKGGGMICDVAFPAITLSPKIFQAVRCHTGVAGRTDGEPRRLQGNRAAKSRALLGGGQVRQQSLGVLVGGMVENLVDGAVLDDDAVGEDHHVLGDAAYHGEVVGDENHR